MAAYTDQTKVSNYLKRDLTAKEIAALPMLANAATEYIDGELETNFQNVTEGSTRSYDGEGISEVDIEPCKDITAVTLIDEYGNPMQTLASHQYVAYPLNSNIKTSIRLRCGNIRGIAVVKVAAKFTSYDGAVPEVIVLAATMLVADYLQSDDYRVKSEETEGWRVQYADLPKFTAQVARLLAPYRRLYS